jgi:hypothetical protein
MRKALALLIIIFVSLFLIGTIPVNADGKKCNPCKSLKKRVKTLEKQMDELNKRLDAMQPRENVEVFDYNDQFIGHLYGGIMNTRYTGGGPYTGPILIPELDAFVRTDPRL